MQPSKNKVVLEVPFGSVELVFSEEKSLIRTELSLSKRKTELGEFESHPAVLSLCSYFRGDCNALKNWPISTDGSAFRQKVWASIAAIPPGKTATYGELSSQIDSSPRAVGGACGDNPLPIFVPCHRVVGKSSLGGFMHGSRHLPIKLWLLEHEKNI